ncbi:MAG: hypothetical protein L0220_33060 [Acidobacteria bacterium]|nr:hypothetical protein [Acidobacteriota bacterium]
MSQLSTQLKNFCGEEGGGEMVEAVLLLGGVILPLVFAVFQIAMAVAYYYSQAGYVISLPFP